MTNLRDIVSAEIKAIVTNARVWEIGDRSDLWHRVAGEVLGQVAKYLNIDIEDGYIVHRRSK